MKEYRILPPYPDNYKVINECDKLLLHITDEVKKNWYSMLTKRINAYIMRGIAYANLGEYDKAISDLTIAIIWDFAILKAISFHEAKQNFDKVAKIKFYATHVTLPNHAFNFVRRGIIYSKIKEYEKAFMDFERGISLNKDMFVWRGNVNSLGCGGSGDSGQFNRVIHDYNEIIDKNPNDAFIYACRGFCYRYNYSNYFTQNSIEQAIEDFTRAIDLEPNLVFAFNGRGNCYVEKRFLDEAIEDYNKSITIAPNNVGSYTQRSYAYFMCREYGRAIDDCRMAIQINRNNQFAPWIEMIYGPYIEKINSWKLYYDGKIEKHSKLISQQPNKASGYIYRGIAYYNLGHFNEFYYNQALQDLTAAIKLNPNSAKVYCYRGLIYVKYRQHDMAINEFNKAISLKPNYEFAYNGRGIAYLKKREYLKAKEDFDKSRILNRYDISCRIKLSHILEVPPYHIIKVKGNKESKEEGKKCNENGKSESVIDGSIKSNRSNYDVNKTIQKMELVAINIKSRHEKKLQRSADKTLKKMGLM